MMTVGHGTHPIEEFVELLRRSGVRALVDVRAFPRSRHNPQFDQEVLKDRVDLSGVSYRWAQALGGRRRPAPGSPNVALRHPSFRAYADHMRTDGFWEALDDVLADDSGDRTAVMCSESLWWRCHRRLIADAALLARGVPVEHIMPDGKLVAHKPTPGVRRADGMLVYDVKDETTD